MSLNSDIYPTKEIILNTLELNPNLNIIKESDNEILFTDAAINFLQGEEVVFQANVNFDIDEMLVGKDEFLNFEAAEFLDTLPEILFFGVNNINIEYAENNTKKENEFKVEQGEINILINNSKSEEKHENNDEIIEADLKFQKEFKLTLTKALFVCLSENPVFFGEINPSEVNFEKFIN